MKKSSSLALIAAGILATTVSVVPMTSPATAQVAPGTDNTTTPATGDRDTRNTTTYERNDDKSGLWGLAGLAGLLGFLGRRKEDDTTVRRGDTPVYRDPNVR